MRLITQHIPLASAMVPRLRCRNLNNRNSEISKICANLLYTKTGDERKQSCFDSSVLNSNRVALKLNDNSKDKLKDIMIKNDYLERQLFGELIKENEDKYVLQSRKLSANKIKSTNNETELQWILKTSNAKYIKCMCNTTQKNTSVKLNEKNIKSVINTDDSRNKMETQDTPKCISKNLLQRTSIMSFPIFGSETSDNKYIEYKEIDPDMEIPSVTKILQDTMPASARTALDKWKVYMTQKLGFLQFEIYCKELLENGKIFHSCIEDTLLEKEVVVPQEIMLEYKSVRPILDDVQTVKTVEARVLHPNLRYKGVVDCVAEYRGELCLVEWKQSAKRKPVLRSTFDAPLQLAAYIGAMNASNDYPYKIDKGLVVVAYRNGKPADVHEVKGQVLQESWSKWLKRLQEFYMCRKKQE